MASNFRENCNDDYSDRLDAILSTPLSPENINSYADVALDATVELIQDVVSDYNRQPTIAFETATETETAAARYFRMHDIDEVLDHLSLKSEEIAFLSHVIGKAALVKDVIVPPDTVDTSPSASGENLLEPKNTIERLKTTLFILQNEFGVDVNNPEEISLATGIVKDNMRRDESYYLIDAPKLRRTILVCDEEGNVTYVFNSDNLSKEGLGEADISALSKSQLNELLVANPNIGQRIVYSNKYVGNIINAIHEPGNLSPTKRLSEPASYLYPQSPEDITSAGGLAIRLGVSQGVVSRAAQQLEEQLGEVKQYRFKIKVTSGYTPEQQEVIIGHLRNSGVLADVAPLDVKSLKALSKSLGVSEKPLDVAVKELEEQLGEVKQYKFGPTPGLGYTSEQQEIIAEYLRSKGILGLEEAPEGISTRPELAKTLGVSGRIVYEAIEELQEQLGEVKKYRFGSSRRHALGYTPEQQEVVAAHLESKGVLTSKAPEGILSITGLSRMAGVGKALLDNTIQELGDRLGEVKQYKFRTLTTDGYTPEQQTMILQQLETKGLLIERAPEEVLSIQSFGDSMGLSYATIQNAAKELGEQLGEVKNYRFGPNAGVGYTPDQQIIITKHLEARGTLSEAAPEGILARQGLANSLGTTHKAVSNVISELGEQLGQIKKYRFGPTFTEGFSQGQQEIIHDELVRRGIIS